MLIESVELHNIKSYAEPVVKIPFRNGVNLIWGENGSGKTTILEAIGYSLFGALDYNLTQFIREGVKEGDVVLTFEGNDERSYQVVRSLKSTASLEIFDRETGRKLVSKRQDAEDWLTDHLGVEFGGYGKRLFENALGVAQGKMTGSFLENDSARKAIFAPILRVDEYDAAWTKLGKTSSELTTRIKNIGEEIARLEGRLEKLTEQEAQLAALADQIIGGETSLASQNARLEEQKIAIASFEACKSDVDEAERKFNDAKHQHDLLAGQLTNAETAWQEAEDANRILQDCQSGYDLYAQASDRKEELLVQQEAYNQGRQQLMEIKRELGEVRSSLSSLAEQLKAVSNAEKRIQELDPLVQRQVQLEELVDKYKEKTAQYQDALERTKSATQAIPALYQQLEVVRQDLNRRTEIESQLAAKQEPLQKLQKAIVKLTANEEDLQTESGELDEKLQVARRDSLKFEEAERNLRRVEKELANAQERLEQIDKQIQERADLEQEIQNAEDEIQKQQANLSKVKAEEQQCHQRAAELQERLDMLQSVEAAECPVCKRPLGDHEVHDIEREFRAEINTWKSKESAACQVAQNADREIGELRKQESALKKRRDKLPTEQRAEEIRGEMAGKQEQILSFKQNMDILAGVPLRVEQLETDRINLNERIAAQRQLLQTRREEVEQAQGLINQLNAELASLAQPAQAADLENRITVYDEDAAHWQAVADGLSDAPTYLEAERAALAELNDPRSEQTRFRGIADQRPGVETEQQRLEYAKAALEGRHQNQEQALQAYAGLEQVLAEVNECLEQNKKTYQAYLANQKTASVHVQRLEFLETIRGQHTAQTALCAKLDTEWQAAQARYDAEQHAQLRNEIEQLGHEIARLDAQLDEWHRRHNELESEILQLRQQQVILDASRQELARLNHLAEVLKFVREGIRQAGPQVVRQRVKAISHSADRIFQDIIEAPSLRLSWDETYAIKVFCRREERLFNQLSGGEQMAAAIAVRLALMIQMSDLRILFLDEPTANLDDTRRDKLADRITSLEGLQQIFVITHDDAFRRDTHHFIQVSKQDGVSIVQVGG